MVHYWKQAQVLNPPDGISVPLLENSDGQWKRNDGFGHCTDQWVHEYKMARAFRTTGGYLEYYLECQKAMPTFDANGKLEVI